MRIGFLQLRSKFGETKQNVKKAVSLLNRVSDATVVLPELFNTGYLFKNRQELVSLAERVPEGYTTSELKKIAKKKNLNLVFGIAQKSGKKFYNSAVYLSSKGKIEVYQKVHLFDREKLFFNAGKSLKVISTPEAKLGMLICFDWIMPEVSRVLTLKGAQILVHPANLVLPWGQAAMKTRCVENGVFGVTANRIGTERRGTLNLTFTGGSQVIGPRGESLVFAGDRSESLKVVEINVEEADNKNITSTNHILNDRFPTLYTPLIRKGRSKK
ncbi:MAG: acyltransferase [Candidatus Krumholzibacteriota bacterium]|nr:acyltransferase [Candidatus Krumholzibacteriota bacterium]